MKHVTIACALLMMIGAAAGYALWHATVAAFGCSLAGLGATIVAMWLTGAEPDQAEQPEDPS